MAIEFHEEERHLLEPLLKQAEVLTNPATALLLRERERAMAFVPAGLTRARVDAFLADLRQRLDARAGSGTEVGLCRADVVAVGAELWAALMPEDASAERCRLQGEALAQSLLRETDPSEGLEDADAGECSPLGGVAAETHAAYYEGGARTPSSAGARGLRGAPGARGDDDWLSAEMLSEWLAWAKRGGVLGREARRAQSARADASRAHTPGGGSGAAGGALHWFRDAGDPDAAALGGRDVGNMDRGEMWMLLVASVNRLIYRVGVQLCHCSAAELRLLSLQFHAGEEAASLGARSELAGVAANGHLDGYAPALARPPLAPGAPHTRGWLGRPRDSAASSGFSWSGLQALVTPRASRPGSGAAPKSARSSRGVEAGYLSAFSTPRSAPREEPRADDGGSATARGRPGSARFTPSLPFVLGVEG